MANVVMYSTRWCPFCVRAKSLLAKKGASVTDIDVGAEPQRRAEMMQRGGGHTVPQIWIGEHYVGGCDELYLLERQARLDALLAE